MAPVLPFEVERRHSLQGETFECHPLSIYSKACSLHLRDGVLRRFLLATNQWFGPDRS